MNKCVSISVNYISMSITVNNLDPWGPRTSIFFKDLLTKNIITIGDKREYFYFMSKG